MSRYRKRSKARKSSRRKTGGFLGFPRKGKIAPATKDTELMTRIAEVTRRLRYILDINQISQQAFHDTLRRFSNVRVTDVDYQSLEDLQMHWHHIVTKRLFWEAWDWMDIRALYIVFLRGSLPSVPTHLAPLVLDSQSQKAQLERVNALGFLTIDSQPGLCEEDDRQRAYVEGYVDSSVCNATQLFDALQKSGTVLVTMTDGQGNIRTNINDITRNWSQMSVNTTEEMVFGQMQPRNITAQAPGDTQVWRRNGGVMLPLTAERQENGTWHLHTNASFSYLLDTKSRDNALDTIMETSPHIWRQNFGEGVVYVQMQHMYFCRSDLIDVVDKALQEGKSSRHPFDRR